MTILRDIAGESNGRNEPTSTLPSPRLPREPRAPVVILSLARRNALIACFNAGALTKKNGAWHLPDDKPTSGVTIADLARDGMLTLRTDSRVVSARLTEQGHWFARTLLCDTDADMPRKRITKTSDDQCPPVDSGETFQLNIEPRPNLVKLASLLKNSSHRRLLRFDPLK